MVWDQENGEPLAAIPCGGGHRAWDVSLASDVSIIRGVCGSREGNKNKGKRERERERERERPRGHEGGRDGRGFFFTFSLYLWSRTCPSSKSGRGENLKFCSSVILSHNKKVQKV